MRLIHAARLSQKARGHEQTGIESSDLEAQRWAADHGHEIVETVKDTKTGTSAMWARPSLKPWVTDPEKLVLYDGIVAYKSDRLSRATWAEEVQIRLWAKEHDKELFIVSPELHWPPANQAEQLSWEIFASQAHQEWKNTSERYRRMQHYLKSQGKLVGRPPFGYDVADAEDGHKTLVPNELGRKYIPQIFDRCTAGESLRTIAVWLNAEGVKPQNSAQWNANSVANIVRCPTYAGRRCEQDPKTKKYGRVILHCEALVDYTTFRRAGEALTNRPKRGPMNNDDKALLANNLVHADCGGPMYRNHRPGGPRTPGYYCVGKYPARTSQCGLGVKCEALDAAVGEFMSVLNLPIVRLEIVPGRDYAEEIEDVQQKLSDLVLQDLTEEDFTKLRELEEEKRRLKSLETEPDTIKEVPTGETYAEKWERLSESERGAWLRSSGVQVFVSRDRVRLMKLLAEARGGAKEFPRGLQPVGGGVWAGIIVKQLRS